MEATCTEQSERCGTLGSKAAWPAYCTPHSYITGKWASILFPSLFFKADTNANWNRRLASKSWNRRVPYLKYLSVLFSSSKTVRLRDGLRDCISDESETEANCPPESGEKRISSHSYDVPWIRNKTVCIRQLSVSITKQVLVQAAECPPFNYHFISAHLSAFSLKLYLSENK